MKRGANLFIAPSICLVLWASAFAGIRLGLRGFGPGQLALFRFLVASVSLPEALGEVPSPLSAVGGFITVAGVILVNALGKAWHQSVERGACGE